jgi:hypothetical protein
MSSRRTGPKRSNPRRPKPRGPGDHARTGPTARPFREEYTRVVEVLGRPPTFTELGIFSAMWSEHCGYKNSKRLLRLLPTEAPWVIQGPGENAG